MIYSRLVDAIIPNGTEFRYDISKQINYLNNNPLNL
jgi:hypothetical protein